MKGSMGRRPLVLGLALALSLAATGWLAAQESGVADEAEPMPARGPARSAADSDKAQAGAEIRIEALQRRADEHAVKELFAARSWQAAPAQAAAPQAPPPPTAPGLPFTYFGKMTYEGGVAVLLTYQDRNLAVRAGEVIDGTYRIDSIQGPVLTITYLPLDTQQTMHIGEQN